MQKRARVVTVATRPYKQNAMELSALRKLRASVSIDLSKECRANKVMKHRLSSSSSSSSLFTSSSSSTSSFSCAPTLETKTASETTTALTSSASPASFADTTPWSTLATGATSVTSESVAAEEAIMTALLTGGGGGGVGSGGTTTTVAAVTSGAVDDAVREVMMCGEDEKSDKDDDEETEREIQAEIRVYLKKVNDLSLKLLEATSVDMIRTVISNLNTLIFNVLNHEYEDERPLMMSCIIRSLVEKPVVVKRLLSLLETRELLGTAIVGQIFEIFHDLLSTDDEEDAKKLVRYGILDSLDKFLHPSVVGELSLELVTTMLGLIFNLASIDEVRMNMFEMNVPKKLEHVYQRFISESVIDYMDEDPHILPPLKVAGAAKQSRPEKTTPRLQTEQRWYEYMCSTIGNFSVFKSSSPLSSSGSSSSSRHMEMQAIVRRNHESMVVWLPALVDVLFRDIKGKNGCTIRTEACAALRNILKDESHEWKRTEVKGSTLAIDDKDNYEEKSHFSSIKAGVLLEIKPFIDRIIDMSYELSEENSYTEAECALRLIHAIMESDTQHMATFATWPNFFESLSRIFQYRELKKAHRIRARCFEVLALVATHTCMLSPGGDSKDAKDTKDTKSATAATATATGAVRTHTGGASSGSSSSSSSSDREHDEMDPNFDPFAKKIVQLNILAVALKSLGKDKDIVQQAAMRLVTNLSSREWIVAKFNEYCIGILSAHLKSPHPSMIMSTILILMRVLEHDRVTNGASIADVASDRSKIVQHFEECEIIANLSTLSREHENEDIQALAAEFLTQWFGTTKSEEYDDLVVALGRSIADVPHPSSFACASSSSMSSTLTTTTSSLPLLSSSSSSSSSSSGSAHGLDFLKSLTSTSYGGFGRVGH